MAELALKVGKGANYKDGDILCAFNSRRIRCTHAQHICHVKQAGGGVGVLRDNAHVARDWFEHTAQYRFERVSRMEIKRITIATLDEVIFSNKPIEVDGKMQHMDVPLYIAYRLTHNRHKIFGTPGAEVWYGGRTDVSNTKMSLVWNAIEMKTAFREVNFMLWPASHKDLISHLFVTTNDFDEDTANDLVKAQWDIMDPDAPFRIHKRRRYIDWHDVAETKDYMNIEDRSLLVDLRGRMTPLVWNDVVKTKAVVVI